MIAKKPVAKPHSAKPTAAKENKFIRSGSAPKNGAGGGVPVLLKFPEDLLTWLTQEATKDGRPRTVYIIRALQDLRDKQERGE